METPLTYTLNHTEEFKKFKEFMCYKLAGFDFEYQTSDSKIQRMKDSKPLTSIPSAISTGQSSEFSPDSPLILKTPKHQESEDVFCSERISRVNNKFSQTLQYYLSLESEFFTVFFQDKLMVPLFSETVNFEAEISALGPALDKVTNYSLFNNYALYFSPVIVFGFILIYILLKKLVAEIKKYRHKYQ